MNVPKDTWVEIHSYHGGTIRFYWTLADSTTEEDE